MKYAIKKTEELVDETPIFTSLNGSKSIVESEYGFQADEIIEILCVENQDWNNQDLNMSYIVECCLKLKFE
jgi:hypothetical protein